MTPGQLSNPHQISRSRNQNFLPLLREANEFIELRSGLCDADRFHGIFNGLYTATTKLSSVRVTAWYRVSRSNGTRPASVISLHSSLRVMPCGVVAPAS